MLPINSTINVLHHKISSFNVNTQPRANPTDTRSCRSTFFLQLFSYIINNYNQSLLLCNNISIIIDFRVVPLIPTASFNTFGVSSLPLVNPGRVGAYGNLKQSSPAVDSFLKLLGDHLGLSYDSGFTRNSTFLSFRPFACSQYIRSCVCLPFSSIRQDQQRDIPVLRIRTKN